MFIDLFSLVWTVFLVQISGSQSHPHGPTREDMCADISPNCPLNAFQCETNTYVQSRCPKTCNLCDIRSSGDAHRWTNATFGCIRGHNDRTLRGISSFGECQDACEGERNFTCRSVEYHPVGHVCSLSGSNSQNDLYETPCGSPYEEWLFAETILDCPSPWVRLGDECFLLVKDIDEHRNWSAASAFCQAQAKESDTWRADLADPKDLGALADHMLANDHATLEWTNTTFGCIRGDGSTLTNVSSFEECQQACTGMQDFICRSASYLPTNETCYMSYQVSTSKLYEAPCQSPFEDSIFAEIKFVSGYWLGGSDLKIEGEWRWINGENITTGWRKNEPNNHSGREDCLEKRPEYGANSLNDWECGQDASFICERYALDKK